ncbi:uncharacterized protein BDW70DRAFT_156817 [Aspergillus foveolatus]|uniref:uncharacterized protein n=1 Tax=Aspergillus foveolatus TaxID=210207 RepID=UPI003CCCB498
MSPVLIALTFILTLVIPQSALIQAQIRYDSRTNHLLCPAPNRQYCAAASLQSSSIISCTQQGTAEIRSCEIALSSILPVGFERAGVCYESSLQSGDAVCAFNGTGYTLEGLEVNVPETVLCDGIPPFPFIPPFAENHSEREEEEKGTTSIKDFYSSQPPVPILRADENLGQYSSYFPVQGTSRAPSLRGGSPFTLSRTSVDEEPSSICSNPWTRHETRKSDILTLNIILVIPITRTDSSETQSKPYISTTPSVLVSTTAIGKASTALPSFCTTTSGDGMAGQDTPTSFSTVATLTPWAVPVMGCEDASRVHETGVPNSETHPRKRTVALSAGAVSVLTLWIGAGTLFS